MELQNLIEGFLNRHSEEIKKGTAHPDGVYGESLNSFKEYLLTLPEFKGVKKINIITMPVYLALAENDAPVSSMEKFDLYLGQKTKPLQIVSIKYSEEHPNI